MIIREKEPANLEMPFGLLDGWITPNEQFYIRSHFPVPEVDFKSWRLKIEGAVAQPVEFSYNELRALPAKTLLATLECAGNSRVFLVPKVKGTQWELGAIGNAEWTGVSLGELLRKAGTKESALAVVLEGADNGAIAEPPRPTGKVHFARSVPLGKAMDDVLLAFQMNGQPLPASHGFPLRAIVPGWYGVASVKWLQRIIVVERPFNGYYETVDYAFWEGGAAGSRLVPITEMQVKAVIARPGSNEAIAAGETYRVSGAAWTGGADVVRVELSTDGGGSWQSASLGEEAAPHCWRLWEFDWQTPATPGRCTLLARATDSRGRIQPNERDPDRGTYMINHCLPIEVEIGR
ncbi:MAG: sulfite oxidase [Chthoniobacterales bacterium]|nr:sulfite oxidase [Chthoniobacterales bacterium]